MSDDANQFEQAFKDLTGHAPMPWQKRLYEQFKSGDFSRPLSLPTGLGKTTVIHIWLLTLASSPERVPRRLVYVVNRRTIVDQATREAEKLRTAVVNISTLNERLRSMTATEHEMPLAISTLRGAFADNGEWCADPSRPAIVVGTVDMIGSRLLFSGYGVGMKRKPFHAGLLGQDSLVIHDEAHLEPAFQRLLESISDTQLSPRCPDHLPLSVLPLTATNRHENDAVSSVPWFTLLEDDFNHPVVKARLNAAKSMNIERLADEKNVAQRITELAFDHEPSGQAVLVFVRRIDDVLRIRERLLKQKVDKDRICLLTGTLRGKERDDLAETKPAFQRFLPPSARREGLPRIDGTVYLICTSAGEVGVDISADHLVCDLTPLDSMAQRLGRVNRYGEGDARVDVVYAPAKKDDTPLEKARTKTLGVLDRLPTVDDRHAASPQAFMDLMSDLSQEDRDKAFTPIPTILDTSDILFDAWAMTSIRGKLPGRPPVAPYLHGVAGWQPAETHVAWRKEVELLNVVREQMGPREFERFAAELLDDYPLKPHELLRDRSERVLDALRGIQKRVDDATIIWIVSENGEVTLSTLAELLDDDKKRSIERIADCTILLPPSAGGLNKDGMLDGASPDADDVADEWLDENGAPRRCRSYEGEPLDGMRLVRTIDLKPDSDALEDADADAVNHDRFWYWYERPRGADNQGSRASTEPVRLDAHVKQVADTLRRTLAQSALPDDVQQALMLAAKWHDLGKKRIVWQRSIGNPNPTNWYAKSGRAPGWYKTRDLTGYRHEFGSLLNVLGAKNVDSKHFSELNPQMQDLVLHVIAAHHGRARPHFPEDEAFDFDEQDSTAIAAAMEVPRRYARLQRMYGRWGLAYLESLLRAADYAASANPKEVAE